MDNLRSHRGKAVRHTIRQAAPAIGYILDAVTPQNGRNHFGNAGYERK